MAGEMAPDGATEVKYADTHSDAILLVVTYSFGWKRYEREAER